MRHRPNRLARRKPVREAYQRAVQEEATKLLPAYTANWLESHPPRAEVPMSTGTWRHPSLDAYDNTYEVEFAPTPRPTSPVWRVPIMASAVERVAMLSTAQPSDRCGVLDMRAVQWGLTAGTTRLRWWNWEPVLAETNAEAEVHRCARGAHAMMERLTPHVKMLAEIDPYGYRFSFGQPDDQMPLPGEVAVRYWEEAVDLLGTWLGLVRARYVTCAPIGRCRPRR